jgi:hypothetical protein
VLTADLPIAADDIEALMAQGRGRH